MGKQGLFVFFALIVIIAGLGMVVYGNMNRAVSPSSSLLYPAQPSVPPSANNLIIADQAAGAVVTVSEADLTEPGFAVIKDARSSGRTLGASVLLSASRNILVFVTAQTVKGRTYYAYLYGDNGDGAFGGGDSVLSDSSGNQLIVPFKAL